MNSSSDNNNNSDNNIVDKGSPIPTNNAACIATTAAATVAAVAVSSSSSIKNEENVPFYFTPPPSSTPIDYDNMMNEYQQFPSLEEFNAIVNDYLQNLSSKKRDKALVDSHRYSLILQVLKDPRNTAISTAQFRFWVKKMFRLSTSEYMEFVCHDDKPVATREDIYNILIIAHKEAHHGGRDKTSALVRKRYSWIPKELIARFVRHCPFCISRRNGCQSSMTGLQKHEPIYTPPTPLSSSALLNFLTTPASPTTSSKKRKNNQPHTNNRPSRPHWTNSSSFYNPNYSISMAANVATSAAAAAVASSYISSSTTTNSPTTAAATDENSFDFYYSQPPAATASPTADSSECCQHGMDDTHDASCSPKPNLFPTNNNNSTSLPPYSYLLFSANSNNNNATSSYLLSNNTSNNTTAAPSAAAAAVVVAAAMAAINSNQQTPSSPSSSVSSCSFSSDQQQTPSTYSLVSNPFHTSQSTTTIKTEDNNKCSTSAAITPSSLPVVNYIN